MRHVSASICVIICSLIPIISLFGQKPKTFKLSLAPSVFFNRKNDYKYVLQSNSQPLELEQDKGAGFMLSTVLLINIRPVPDEAEHWSNQFHFVLSLPLAEYYENEDNKFNRTTSGSLGIGYKMWGVYGLILANYGQIDRMTNFAYRNQQFPLNVYQGLTVNGELPENVLQPYLEKKGSWFFSIGITADLFSK